VMVDGLSRREAAKRFGVHRNTITKMLHVNFRRELTQDFH
jgi:transposase